MTNGMMLGETDDKWDDAWRNVYKSESAKFSYIMIMISSGVATPGPARACPRATCVQ